MKRIPCHIILILFAVCGVMTGCIQPNQTDRTLLAEVGPRALTVEEALRQIPAAVLNSDSASALEQYRDEWIRRQLILQEADRLNFTNRAEVQEKLKRLQDEFVLQSVQDVIIGRFEEDLEVTDQEARNYYQQHKEEFTLEEQYVRYRHLIATSGADAENAKRELQQGVPWEQVARSYSIQADLKIRESQKYWPLSVAGGEVEVLNRYLRVIGPSEISPTHRIGNEYHFVQLMDERPAGDHPDLDWLIAQIKEWLILEKRKRAFNSYVKNLYLQGQANNEIKVYSVTDNEHTAQTDTASLNQLTDEE